jgi:hypothetical protein
LGPVSQVLSGETKAKCVPDRHDELESIFDRLETNVSVLLLWGSPDWFCIARKKEVTQFVAAARHRPERAELDPVIAPESDLLRRLTLGRRQRRLTRFDGAGRQFANGLIERVPVLASEHNKPVGCNRADARESVRPHNLVGQLTPVRETDKILFEPDVPG